VRRMRRQEGVSGTFPVPEPGEVISVPLSSLGRGARGVSHCAEAASFALPRSIFIPMILAQRR
jgi:hypothetical protein